MGLEAMLDRALALGHRRIALTDVNNLCGATRFWKLAAQRGIQPITGAELSEGGLAVTALVAADAGYENLCRLISRINRRLVPPGRAAERPSGGAQAEVGQPGPRRPRPALVLDLAELSDGLVLIVEDDSLACLLAAAGLDRRRFYVGIDPATQGYARLRRLAEAADRLGLDPVATAPAMLADAGDLPVARLLAAIRLGGTFESVSDDQLPHPRAVLRGCGQLAGELADFPQALRNNAVLAETCSAFRLLPHGPVFPAFATPDGKTAAAHLQWLCRKGLQRRYGKASPAALARLEEELALIEAKGFSEYFLVVRDIVKYAHDRGAPVAGRGSGASSLVAYLLGITNVCPLAYDIPFERFLNDQREDFPDLDVDFCWRLRDEVIDYAFSRWGQDYVAMVSMHLMFQPRSAVRETAKAMGLSNQQISRLVEEGIPSLPTRLPVSRQAGRRRAGGQAAESGLSRRGKSRPPSGLSGPVSERIEAPNVWRSLLDLSGRILHLPHSLSVHPGGIVIGRKPIDHYVPVQMSAKGVWITQYDKDGVEDAGLVKLDLLGNRNLSTIRYACDLVAERAGRRIDVESLPIDDGPTVELLQAGKTVGCNQLESPAMRHLLRMMRPADARDVMKALALIRPGAAGTPAAVHRGGDPSLIGMKETFIRRHRGLEQPPAAPACVASVLAGAYGVMLYEDDVMLAAAAMLGCPLGQADRFRKAVQKCPDDQARLALSRRFLAGCQANGIDLDYAKGMWVQMAKYNAYSFCRAHAASYALLAYAGAYLKAHWPVEFWTAALNNNQSMYHPRVYVEQAKRDGVGFLLPDVNRGGQEFTIDDDASGAIRAGLNLVAGLGPAGIGRIIDARRQGPFEGLSDFLARTRLGDQEVRSLALCGAFDSFGRTRPGLMMELNLSSRLERTGGGDDGRLLRSAPVAPDVAGDYSPLRKYLDQRRILGITVGPHLMALHRPLLAGCVDADSRDIDRRPARRVSLAGLLEARRTTATQDGKAMMFLTLDDEYGLFEVTLFPSVARRARGGFTKHGPYVVTGTVEDQYDSLSITAASVEYRGAPEGRLPQAAELLAGAAR